MSRIVSNSLSTPPDPDSPENILNKLYDDCLHTIFSSSTLDISDLVQIANVCQRFNCIAKEVFKVKHKNFDEIVIPLDGPFEDILRAFGESINNFGSAELNDIQCELIAKYCPNIKKLKCTISEQHTIDGLRELIVRLDNLHITLGKAFMSIKEWSGADIQLKSLLIKRKSSYLRLPKGNLPKLFDLNLGLVQLGESELLLRENPQLEKLSMWIWHEDTIWPIDYSCFGSLQNLRSLDIKQDRDIIEAMEVLKTISEYDIRLEHLAALLPCSKINEHFKYIGQIKSLKTLDLRYIDFTEAVARLVQNLPNLVDLNISSFENKNGFKDIRAFVENAGGSLQILTYSYEIWVVTAENNIPDETEFERMDEAARMHGIQLRIRFTLAIYKSEPSTVEANVCNLCRIH